MRSRLLAGAAASTAAVFLLTTGALLAGAAPSTSSDSPQRHATHRATAYVPGELIVRYRTGVTTTQRASVRARADVRRVRGVALSRTEVVRVGSGSSVRSVDRFLSAQSEIEFAEPNYYRYARVAPPGPPTSYATMQWSLENDGTQAVNGNPAGTADADIDAEAAWDTTDGDAGSRIAVIDSGVDYRHPGLNDNLDLAAAYDFIDSDADPEDIISGHGTHVAGIIGAEPLAGTGGGEITGINQDSTIVPIRALGDDGTGTASSIIDAIDHAGSTGAGLGNAAVVNMSLGSASPSAAERAAIASYPNVLFVVASDNGSANASLVGDYPCDYTLRNIVCVAASDIDDAKASFSNWGSASVDIAAPGKDIYSTFPAFLAEEKFAADPTDITTVDADTTNDNTAAWVPGKTAGTTWAWDATNEDVEDSAGGASYVNSSNTWIASPDFDLSLRDAGTCRLAFYAETYLEEGYDKLYVQYDAAGSGTWTTLTVPGVGTSFTGEYVGDYVIPLSFAYTATVRFRFRLTSDSSGTDDGVYIDDVRINCDDANGSYGSAFAFESGTSMATPHVAGVAGLVKAVYPTADAIWVREAILQGGDDVPGGSNWLTNPFHTATDRRLNAAGALAWAAANTANPTEVRLVGPAEDSSTTDTTPTLTWLPAGADTGIVGYRVYVDGAEVTDMTTGIETASTLSYTSGVLAVGYHSWRVQARDASGDTTSETRSFRVVVKPAVGVKLSSSGGTARSCGASAGSPCPNARGVKEWFTGTVSNATFSTGAQVTTRVYRKTASGGWSLSYTFPVHTAGGGYFPDDVYAFGRVFSSGKYRVQSTAAANELTLASVSAYRYFNVS